MAACHGTMRGSCRSIISPGCHPVRLTCSRMQGMHQTGSHVRPAQHVLQAAQDPQSGQSATQQEQQAGFAQQQQQEQQDIAPPRSQQQQQPAQERDFFVPIAVAIALAGYTMVGVLGFIDAMQVGQ